MFFELAKEITWVDWINIILLACTVILLWKYTRATQGLKKTTILQTELNQRPCVILATPENLKFNNVGYHTAVNIRILSITKGNMFFNFWPCLFLKKDQMVDVNLEICQKKNSRPQKKIKKIDTRDINHLKKVEPTRLDNFMREHKPYYEKEGTEYYRVPVKILKKELSEHCFFILYENLKRKKYYSSMRINFKTNSVEFLNTGDAKELENNPEYVPDYF